MLVYKQNSEIAGVGVRTPMPNERMLVNEVTVIDGPASSIVSAERNSEDQFF